MTELELREAIVMAGASLFHRGLTPGTSGNISVRSNGGWLVTPTGACLGSLAGPSLSLLDANGHLRAGPPPTKEVPLHLAMYRNRPALNAVVHLHSHFAVAASIVADIDPANVLPALTAYYIMRVGCLPLVPYLRPGHPALGEAVTRHAGHSDCCLLANHGPVAGGRSLMAAIDAIEEIEQTAQLWFQLRGLPIRPLAEEEVRELRPDLSGPRLPTASPRSTKEPT